MFDQNLFSKRLVGLRKANNITTVDLAKAIGVSKQAISQFEKCISYPHCRTLAALADYFDVPIDYLTGAGFYKNWEEILECKEDVCDVVQKNLPDGFPDLKVIPEALLMSFLASFMDHIDIDPDTHAVTLYPKFPLEYLRNLPTVHFEDKE